MPYYWTEEYANGWHIDEYMRADLCEKANDLIRKTSNTLESNEALTDEEFYKLDDTLLKALCDFEWYTEQDVDDTDVEAKYEELENLCFDMLENH